MKTLTFKICFFITIVGGIILKLVDFAEPGIIPFELARTIENANEMVASWQAQEAISYKKFSLYFDYLFIVGYAGSLHLIIKEWWQKSDQQWIYYLSVLPLLAGILDGVENLGLLKIVYLNGTQFNASLAFFCASVKFLILIPSLLGALYYLVLKNLRKI